MFLAALFVLAALPTPLSVQITSGFVIAITLTIFTLTRIQIMVRVFITMLIYFASARYITWRATDTLVFDDPVSAAASLILFAAELFSFIILVLNLFVNSYHRDRKPAPLPATTDAWPTVDVLVPSYNEDAELVEATLLAARRLVYREDKLNIYLLDDGATEARLNSDDPEKAKLARERRTVMTALCDELGVHYLSRSDNRSAKAGNINAAFEHIDGDLILILDADHVPSPDFLEHTAGYFVQDREVFLVQTPHFFINPDPLERNLQTFADMPSENEMFYRLVQRGLDSWNASYFCGSAALLRRKHLDEIGGLRGETITEDAETALELHARGKRSVYVSRQLVAGLNPETVAAFISQRTRWAQGMAQILLLKNPLLKKGLSVGQRLGYLSSILFWFFSWSRLVFLVTPTLHLIFGFKLIDATLLEILAYGLPHLFGTLLLSSILFRQVRWPLISEAYEALLSLHCSLGVFKVLLNPRAPTFVVTPKSERLERESVSPIVWPFLALCSLLVYGQYLGIAELLTAGPPRPLTEVVIFWNTVNLITLMIVLAVSYERRQVRGWPRMSKNEPVRVNLGGQEFDARLIDCSLTGGRLAVPESVALHCPQGERGTLRSLSPQHKTDCAIGMEVRRMSMANQTRFIGVRYLRDTLAAKELSASLMYGNSADWAEFVENRGAETGQLRRVWRLIVWTLTQLTALGLGMARAALSVLTRPGKKAPMKEVAFLLAFMLIFTSGAMAQQANPTDELSAHTLADFRTQQGPLRLNGKAAFDDLIFEIPPHVTLDRVFLDIDLRHSAVLDPQSLLSVILNERTVAQLPLRQENGRLMHQILLAPEDFKTGSNRLAFSSALTLGRQCEANDAPQFWVEIQADRSSLNIASHIETGEFSLADLKGLLKPGLGDMDHIRIWSPEPGGETLNAIGLAVQGIALHQIYQTPELSFQRLDRSFVQTDPESPGAPSLLMDPSVFDAPFHLVVGRAESLAPYLADEVVEEITGPYLRIDRVGGDRGPVILVVSGRTDAELRVAATALGIRQFPWPASRSAVVDGVLLPSGGDPDPGAVEFARTYQFGELGFGTTGRSGVSAAPVQLVIDLPADFFSDKDSEIILALDYTYGPGARRDSALNVSVNGLFFAGIGMNQIGGSSVRGYDLRIPLSRFQPGRNEITFSPIFLPEVSGECVFRSLNSPTFSLFESSGIGFPEVDRILEIPDLSAFGLDGLPHLIGSSDRYGDIQPPVVFVGAQDPATLAAALTLSGKMAQLAGRPLVGMTVTMDRAVLDGEQQIIAVAPSSAVPRDWARDMPIALGRTLKLGELVREARFVPLHLKGQGPGTIQFTPALPVGGLGRLGAIMQFATEDPDQLVTLVTASSPELLRQRAHALVQPQFWSQLHGALFLWETERDSAVGFASKTQRRLGELTAWHDIENWTGRYPYIYIGVMILGVLVISMAVWWRLTHRKRRIGNA
ncbi:MAG: UDP-forming cellulose synthase catalytic subunit [Sphingomonadales bacterium]